MREDWIECKIGELFEVVTGSTPSKNNEEFYSSNDYPFYKPTDLNAGINVSQSLDYLSNSGYVNSRNAPAKSVLVTCIGATIGKTGLIRNSGGFNQQINAVIPNSICESVFTYYQIISAKFQKELIKNSSSTTLPIINKSRFNDLNFSLPPLPEQRAIVKKLESLFSSLDAGVADLKKAQQQLKIYRQAVLKKAFNKVSEFTSIGSLVEMQAGLAFKKSEYSNGGIRLFQIANVFFNKTKWDSIEYLPTNYKEKYPELLLKNDDIVMALNRPLLNDYLKIAQIKSDDLPSILYQRVGRFHFNNNILNKYFLYYLQSPNFIIWLKEQLQGVNIPFINKSKLFSYSDFPICSLEEQNEIVKQIESRLSVCDSIEQNIKESLIKAEALRQSILKKAFEGNLLTAQELAECKQAADYEPARVLLERVKAEQKGKTVRKMIEN